VSGTRNESGARKVPHQFIGRERELAAAANLLDAAANGHGSVLVLAGDPGIGKSRLAREIARLAHACSMKIVWAAGWPEGGAGPYWPWQEILAEIDASLAATLEVESSGPDSQRFERFRSAREALRRGAL